MERTSTVELQRADFSAEFELPAVWTSIIEVFRFVKKFSSAAELIQKIEGEEEVEKMDTLLSLALTGGDYSWI